MSTVVSGLKDVVTNAQLSAYVSEPDIALTTPTENDGKYLLNRLYSENRLNWCRALDQNLIIRVVSRNYGTQTVTSDYAAAALPTPSALFNIVWGLVPDFVKTKVKQWAKDNMDGAIANEITQYVKTALGMLPIPIPGFFVNSVASLVIPPLVTYIISSLGRSTTTHQTTDADAIRLSFTHSAESLKVMKDFDRKILLAAGLNRSYLPAHLAVTDNEDGLGHGVLGQPDNRDCRVDMKQFYQADVPNGSKPLQFMQIVAAQIRTNPSSDPDPVAFGGVVWNSLNSSTKTQLQGWARENPPNRDKISTTLYTPVKTLLAGVPYSVPTPIRQSFTAMKTPEVTEWLIKNHGGRG